MRDEAISMLKAGQPPAAIYHRLLAVGFGDHAARALLDELLVLKQRAEALDPKRLRDEAIWMFWNGSSAEHVLAHFIATGVPEEHARPEVDRIFVAVSKMRPCERCRRPMEAGQGFFDGAGRQVCRPCHSIDEIGNANRRALDSELESAGVPSWALQASQTSYLNAGHAHAPPMCPRCRSYATVAYGRWFCSRCSTPMS